jgi:hypothetical protein
MRTDGRTDRHDEANSGFSQFFRKRLVTEWYMGRHVEGQARELFQALCPNFLVENLTWAPELRNRSANRRTATFGRQELAVTCHVVVFDSYEDPGYRLT